MVLEGLQGKESGGRGWERGKKLGQWEPESESESKSSDMLGTGQEVRSMGTGVGGVYFLADANGQLGTGQEVRSMGTQIS